MKKLFSSFYTLHVIRYKLQKNRGFTLIELLTVIAIIAILTAIVVPNLNNARIKGRDAKRISDLKSIQLALAIYYDTHRSTGYPAAADLYTSGANYLSPTYIPVVPKDPKGGSNYFYSVTTSSGMNISYCLGTDLEGTPPLNEDSPCAVSTADFTVQN